MLASNPLLDHVVRIKSTTSTVAVVVVRQQEYRRTLGHVLYYSSKWHRNCSIICTVYGTLLDTTFKEYSQMTV